MFLNISIRNIVPTPLYNPQFALPNSDAEAMPLDAAGIW